MKKEINMEKLIWKEITGKKIRTFQLADEPYVIYVIPTRHDEYVIVKDDAYEMETGETEMLKGDEVKDTLMLITISVRLRYLEGKCWCMKSTHIGLLVWLPLSGDNI